MSTDADDRADEADDATRGESTVADDGNAMAYGGDDDGAMSADGFDGEGFDGSNAYDADDGGDGAASALLWFSVASAVIMGALWLGSVLDVWDFFLGNWWTLAIAVVAAVGAALTAYGMSDEDTGGMGAT